MQHHLNELLKVKGCNGYVQPHFGKKVEEDNGRLKIQVKIPTQQASLCEEAYDQASQTLVVNEDVAQTSNAMQEAYDQAIEET